LAEHRRVVVETFIWKPSYDVQVDKVWSVITSKFENGTEQRRTKESSPTRVFTFKFGVRTLAQIKKIEDFWDARQGSFGTFIWIDPKDNAYYVVKFVDGSFKKTFLGKGYASLELQMIEVKGYPIESDWFRGSWFA
jgi:phage-related protein